MPARNIVLGQHVSEEKVARARQLRREMTSAERALWERLRTNKLKGLHFRRQQVIRGFIVDFYCHAAGLVVEVDGQIHDGQKARDAERDAALADLGLRVIRVRNEDVEKNLGGVLDRIATACETACARRNAT
jgi:very-short-patch-repair endonuclease